MLLKTHISAALAAALTLCAAAPASAALMIAFDEVGDDVVAVLSGSLDLSGYASVGNYYNPNLHRISSGYGGYYSVSGTYTRYNFEKEVLPAFGSALSYTTASSWSGDNFYGTGTYISVPTGYVYGSALSGQITFANMSLADLGMSAGIYSSSLPSDSITIAVAQDGDLSADVPVPAAAPLLLGALGLGAFVSRRKG